ncbi:MAG TPA: Hsp20/alpha crystallin family protein [Armatimonadetes bacterium]|nr:Hsp20/alpha crystallin family protein [Armatimonadota bacterium]
MEPARKFNLFAEIQQLHEDLERLFRDVWQTQFPRPAADGKWRPLTDVYQVEGATYIKMELAGVRREDISVVGEGNRLVVSGMRYDFNPHERRTYTQMEINYGPFERVFILPFSLQEAEIEARYEHGFLTIRLMPRPVSTPTDVRRIEVRTEA